METSRQVQKISVSDELYQKLKSDVEKQKREKEKEALQGLIARYKEIEADLNDPKSDINQDEWISFDSDEFRACMKKHILIINENTWEPSKIELPIENIKKILKPAKMKIKDKFYPFDLPAEDELKAILFDKPRGIKKNYQCGVYLDEHMTTKWMGKVITPSGVTLKRGWAEAKDKIGSAVSSASAAGIVRMQSSSPSVKSARLIRVHHLTQKTLMEVCMEMKLVPDHLSESQKKTMELVFEKMKSGELRCQKGKSICINEKMLGDSGKETISEDNLKEGLIGYLLQCDHIRSDMRVYEQKILEDPMKGHWDIWPEKKTAAGKNAHTLDFKKQRIMAKNPVSSVRKNGIIGIDFGTKSTVVACQDGSEHIVFKRIGVGDISKKERKKDYENPTVMQFRDVQSFVEAYQKKQGRPYTEWNDMIVSHSAARELNGAESVNPEAFYSFFSDLKQWAREETREFIVRDLKGKDYDLQSYLTMPSVQEGGIDPIEIYAYYLGLYINNMDDGIYMKYLLSFPVNYEKKVRERIRRSFECGIKKSIPEVVFQDPEAGKLFQVQEGAGEPEAYAICAIKEFGIEPEEGKPVFYGVFDFGGGTTDYDFGIVRDPEESECDRYDYEVVHLGDGGDPYLGGENILKKLAYQVLLRNIDLCQKQDIVFQKPEGTEPGNRYQYYIDASKEAYMNMKMVMEKLRPFWERTGGEKADNGKSSESAKGQLSNKKNNTTKSDEMEIAVTLFDRTGNMKPQCKLKINKEEINKWIREEIEHGVRNFFEQFKSISERKELNNVQGMKIFLAGNSCKSPYVQEAFEKEIKKISSSAGKEGFEIYSPLGSDKVEQEQSEIKDDSDVSVCPNGKTGVAYGLILGRPTGKFKILKSESCSEEAAFHYYLGINRRDKFITKLSRDDHKYDEWIKFRNAVSGEKEFEMLFTTLAEVTTQKTPVRNKGIHKMMISLKDETKEGESIYMKFVEPRKIQCGVGKDANSIRNNSIITVVVGIGN